MVPSDDIIKTPFNTTEAPFNIDTDNNTIIESSGNERADEKIHICLLEDPYSQNETIEEKLDGHGYKLDQFYSVKDCHAALVGHDYKLLIIDRPIGATGIENFIHSLRTVDNVTSGQLSIIVVTEESNPETLKDLHDAGSNKVITKPYQGDLNNIITVIIDNIKIKLEPIELSENLSICLYEDCNVQDQIFVDEFNERGYSVDFFSDTDEALYSLIKNQYDLLIVSKSDYGDDKESIELIESYCKLIAQKKRDFPIVVLTQDTSPENLTSFMAAGANLVIAKRINGKPNNNIFLIAQIIKTTQSKKIKASPFKNHELEEIPTLDFNLSKKTNTTHNSKIHQPKTNQSTQSSPKKKESFDIFNDKTGSIFSSFSNYSAKTKKRFISLAEKKRQLIFGIGMTITFVIGFVLWTQINEVTTVNIVETRQGALSQSAIGSGKIVTRKQVLLTSATSGQVAKVLVKEGEKVKKGDVLAVLDDRQANINLRRAEVELTNANSELESKKKLLSEFKNNSNTTITDKLSNVMIKDFENGLNETQAKYRIAAEELRAARSMIDQLKVVAPFDALILESYAVEGLWAAPPGPLFNLIDPTQLEASILISRADARNIVVGQPVTVSSSTSAEDTWEGQVTHISFESSDLTQNNPILIYASVNTNMATMRYGQPVDARIITKTNEKTIKLPFEAVFEHSGQKVVALIENERIKFQSVDTGIRDLTEIEIIKGLKSGEPVVLDRKGLEAGARVKTFLVKVDDEKMADEPGFPYRKKYSDVAIITTDQLRKSYDNSIIVDVRSHFEFDVVHINKAVNIPLASEDFIAQISKIRSKNDSRPIVFYCNGHTCTKSYKAIQIAAAAGFGQIYAYDSGIFDWLRANRDLTMLLGTTPAPLDKLVSNDYFHSRLLSFEEFKEQSVKREAVIIDIRDDIQKVTKLAMPATELPLDQLLAKLNAGEYKDKQLLIFDAAGQQVRWLQYLLKDKGYEHYYFLRDGIDGITS